MKTSGRQSKNVVFASREKRRNPFRAEARRVRNEAIYGKPTKIFHPSASRSKTPISRRKPDALRGAIMNPGMRGGRLSSGGNIRTLRESNPPSSLTRKRGRR